MNPLGLSTAVTAAGLLLLCGLLHLFPRLGRPGRALSAWLCKAPGLDLLVTSLTIVPLVAGPALCGWRGLLGAVLGQFSALFLWVILHELAHPEVRKKDRILKVHRELIGMPATLFCLVLMSAGVPVFWLVRLIEVAVYPWLVWLAKFPPYVQADWVNISRHKFPHLVGHDRVWCLYCDWMTGLSSLGTEMLRNVESFWCPVRFQPQAKCDHCVHEFPDIVGGWAPFESDAETAGKIARDRYITQKPPRNAWFGHPARLTVRGETLQSKS